MEELCETRLAFRGECESLGKSKDEESCILGEEIGFDEEFVNRYFKD
jgi:hypothetical protein